MTGQILMTNNHDKKSTNKFHDFLKNIAYSLNDLGYHDIYKFFPNISVYEIEWAANYLNYSSNKLKEEYDFRENLTFLISKAIAILSVWAGYISVGGVSPPPMVSSPNIDVSYKLKNISMKKSDISVVVIIPTKLSFKETVLLSIKKNLLHYLTESDIIKRVLFVGSVDYRSEKYLKSIHKISFINVDENKDSPSYSRNIGIEESISLGADVTMFIDDDVHIRKQEIVKKLTSKAYNSKGVVSPLVKGTKNGWLEIFHNYDGTLNGVYYKNNNLLLYATTCCVAISNEVFLSALRFDESFKIAAGEDIDFSIRALQKGFPIIPEDNIKVLHDYRYTNQSLNKFIKRYMRYGMGNYTLFTKHPYYYSLLSKCSERKTWDHFSINEKTIIPSEFPYVETKIGGVFR